MINTEQQSKNILISRTDKLGDFVLSLPSFVLLKKTLPNTNLIALTQEYTKPIAELCDSIDTIVTIPKSDSTIKSIKDTLRVIKPLNIDVSISLFTTATLAISLFLSKIPLRIAPATKIDQLFYNHRLKQRRSLSLKPEFEYNRDLVKYYLDLNNKNYINTIDRPILKVEQKILTQVKNTFLKNFNIGQNNKLIFIHVGSGGSANNLSTEQYARLITILASNISATFVLCEGPEDSNNVNETIALLKLSNFIRYISNKGLLEFTRHIAIADFFISGSTGPLHIAGALDIPTAGFYPNRQSATLTRWKTLNSKEKLLAFSPIDKVKDDMADINLNLVSNSILKLLSVI